MEESFGRLSGKEGERGVFRLLCKEGERLRLRGRGERFVHALGIACGEQGGELEEVGYARGVASEVGCEEHEEVVGVQVQSGALIDAVGLICAAR